ncbi:MAG: sigma-70 family RNA polymerase sigma factor [Phycisphaerales bacterium]|nr:sigma-70 family RNA polymerase sigma factor [Phycisphaerales bacterium]
MTDSSGFKAPEIELVVADGPKMDPIRIQVDGPKTIGRSRENDLTLSDPGVSRIHATLDLSEGRVQIADSGSRGGTYLNMVRVDANQPEVLCNRDLISIGPWKLLVRLEEEEAAEPSLDQTDAPEAIDKEQADPARQDPMYATRASIFLRLQARGTIDREFGWNEFTDKYSSVIAGFARNAGLKAQDADDILQDVLMGFFRVSSEFEYDPNKGRFRGYLKRVTLNAIRGRFRRKRPSQNYDGSWEPPALDADTDILWDRQWTEQLLYRAMAEVRAKVEDRTWKAFELYGLRGAAVEAVCEETGMTPDAVRHAKMRITKQVRELVNTMRDEEG